MTEWSSSGQTQLCTNRQFGEKLFPSLLNCENVVFSVTDKLWTVGLPRELPIFSNLSDLYKPGAGPRSQSTLEANDRCWSRVTTPGRFHPGSGHGMFIMAQIKQSIYRNCKCSRSIYPSTTEADLGYHNKYRRKRLTNHLLGRKNESYNEEIRLQPDSIPI